MNDKRGLGHNAPYCSASARLRNTLRAFKQILLLGQGPGKKWEHYELTKKGKPVRHPMHVKMGDTVVVIAGSEKGTVGKVSEVCAVVGLLVRTRKCQ